MRKFFAPLVLIGALIGGSIGGSIIGPATAAFWEWSKTASSNANADPSINWAEGMSPSSVNDSARAMMARAAEYRDDISGALTTGGLATAYTLSTNQGLDTTPVNGQMLAFVPHLTNGAAATLTVDGGNTYPLQTSPGVGLGAGTISAGTPYRTSFNLTAGAWVLEAGYASPYSIPLGGLMASTADTPPNSGFILPAGQCISRTTYAAYFALVGIRFGACDGSTTFAAPDLRGRLFAGLDNLNGTPANVITSAATGCGTAFTSVGVVCGSQSSTLTAAQIPAHKHPITDKQHDHAVTGGTYAGSGSGGANQQAASLVVPFNALLIDISPAFTGITETDNSTGGGGAHPILPPIFGVSYFLRVI